ncbi:MAG: alpha-keto acid decarboxylase family protein [Candidatus Omnitrophica bacterium]|nr:alpha-keto acid decarboxylase family protein [Candidatus Omnitrophota bacterium]
MRRRTTIGSYLVKRLEEAGLKQIFGVPGDYVLGFYDLLVESPIEVIGTCTEGGAGFAADAYARVHGLGAICITYCVGGFNALNAVAGAYAEKSPLIVISGSPGLAERAKSPLLHHQVRGFNTQHLIFDQVCVASAALEDPLLAPQQIDETIAACIKRKRPVYLEIPRDMVHAECQAPKPFSIPREKSDRGSLKEALGEATQLLRKSKRPVILAGVEIHRFNLQESLLKLAKKSGFPVAATLLGKSVISENHPDYIGVYEGAMGKESVQKTVEGADCVLILGAFMTDINLGINTAQLDLSKTINATSETISIKRHHYDHIVLRDFIEGLAKADLGSKKKRRLPSMPELKPYRAISGKPMTIRRFFQRINQFLQEDSVVVCDIGDSLFGAIDLRIHKRTEFLSPAYYTSMGFAIPAALGVQVGSKRLRPLVFVGDGAFQMTFQELSTIARHGLNPIVFVLNNQGYTTERFINEGPYNDIKNWAYHELPSLLQEGWAREVHTEDDLEEALEQVKKQKVYSLINVHLEKMDHSEALARLGRRLSKSVGRR